MTDVIIVGSGAGGLSAAVTAAHHGLKVTVVEKADVLGGATTWSGGWAWTPGSSFARRDGVHEDAEEFRTYLRAVLGERYRGDVAENIDAFLDAAPDMVDFFHDNTRLQFTPGSAIKDIYGDLPGAGTGHRSVGPAPFNARRIRPEVRAKLRHQLYETSFLGMGIMAGPDLRKFLSASRGDVSGWFHAARRVLVHAWDMVVHRRNMQMVNGAALVGRLAASADDLGVTMLTGTTAHELLTDGAGRVTGVRVQGPDGTAELAASCGVVLATGGFPADVELRSDLFPRTPTGREHHTLAPEEASGDGLRLALSVGAASCTDLAAPAAWCPVSQVPYLNGKVGTFPHIMDRAKPGSIGVVSTGRRFVNEADGYHDYVTAMLDAAPAGEPVCSWQVADSTFVRRYPMGMAKPFPVPLLPYVRNGYLVKGRTLREVAEKCGIDPDGLEATVARFNDDARRGEDTEFHRGATEFNRYGGDPAVGPNPSLAPVEKGPFYAVKVLPGSFGTFAGVSADGRARVLGEDGAAIPGLYTAGNDRASIMGGFYPAGGINLGPALTFGYVAGRELAGV
ncbi:MAG: FAD-dependent oxidoreductase [Corynebacterium sp.]|uniref:FAD-dependent oxidoreductase n=1 Tax=unclassified Corynebacterium TaxID=2624378 RepID=UPI0026476FDA|nr:FAD-dependent oxidoreductase [Corynebacterium sp.]MDN5582811.1 FAD-dependent oxidoreductase [Corynebacterium sp.]MDN5719030.1 FAD-dependent oxidoreductase [Corynebacterium sp.]MDN6386533.1 FAD-dependent oxidoreductase [Corynebacterium sp.]